MNDFLNYFIPKVLADNVDLSLTLPSDTFLKFNGEAGFTAFWADLAAVIFAFLGLAAFFGVIYSGVMMITAGGDAAKFTAGRKNLIWSIIGIVVVTLAYFVISFILNILKDLKP